MSDRFHCMVANVHFHTLLHFEVLRGTGVCVCVMGCLRQVGSIKLQVSFAKDPYKRDNILQKRRTISSILLTVATPYLRIVLVLLEDKLELATSRR